MTRADPSDERTLICYLRSARRKAREVATVEVLRLLHDLSPHAPVGGPLSEQGGLFWITLPQANVAAALLLLPRLGYSEAVDLVEPVGDESTTVQRPSEEERHVRWKRRLHRLVRVYEEDAAMLREMAPDRRIFHLETGDGVVRPIRGYRGDGGTLSRRGLPVYDARLLVNLVRVTEGARLLDPFAGIGGIVIEARACGHCIASADIDRSLRFGLFHLGAHHCVADASALPFASACFDAVATEPPYHAEADAAVQGALREMVRVLRVGGRLALLCAASQVDLLRTTAADLGLASYLDAPINRKGLDVAVLAWLKTS